MDRYTSQEVDDPIYNVREEVRTIISVNYFHLGDLSRPGRRTWKGKNRRENPQ